jgi:hypothetical protein
MDLLFIHNYIQLLILASVLCEWIEIDKRRARFQRWPDDQWY